MSEKSRSSSMMRDPHKTGMARVVAQASEGQSQLFGSEHGLIVLRIDSGIVAIPLFKIDVPSSSKMLGLVPSFPGWKRMTRLKAERYLDQRACRCVRILVVEKYWRFR